MADKKIYRVDVPEITYVAKFVEATSAREALSLSEDDAQVIAHTYTFNGDDDEDLRRDMTVAQMHDLGCVRRVFAVECDDGEPADRQVIESTSNNEDLYNSFQEWDEDFNYTRIKLKEGAMTTTSKTKQIAEAVKANAMDAGMRAAAAEFADTVREPVAALLLKEIGLEDNGVARAVVGRFLGTKVGEGAFSLALGAAIPAVAQVVPEGPARDAALALGKELRVAGQATLLRPVVRVLSGPVQQFILAKIDPAKVRVLPEASAALAEGAAAAPAATARRAARA